MQCRGFLPDIIISMVKTVDLFFPFCKVTRCGGKDYQWGDGGDGVGGDGGCIQQQCPSTFAILCTCNPCNLRARGLIFTYTTALAVANRRRAASGIFGTPWLFGKIFDSASVREGWLHCSCYYLWSGPNGIKNFNPGIFRDGILPNPGIPGFFGTGFSNIFDPGI